MKDAATVHLGFEIGSGKPVSIPIAHTFVTGQTQLSGKTTTLRAIVERSKRRALAFITKRGEDFAGRRVKPFLPRQGDRPISWRLVESIMAGALGQRNMKWERGGIVVATKGATSLEQVRSNIARLMNKSKSGKTIELYMLLGEYLDLILPEMRQLDATDALDLEPGLNVMDLGGISTQLQALVIRAAIEQINLHEKGVLVVFPEAWEFAPRGRSAPAKDEAMAMARKGAVLGNFLLSDSQDIAGVDTVIRQATSVWILGVQRELNELKRTIDSIPAGIARPKSADVATQQIGEFFACWGRHAIHLYVQPPWMDEKTARAIAMGERDSRSFVEPARPPVRIESPPPPDRRAPHPADRIKSPPAEVPTAGLTDEDPMSQEEIADLKKGMSEMARAVGQLATAMKPTRGKHADDDADEEAKSPAASHPSISFNGELDTIVAAVVERISTDPKLIKLATTKPIIELEIEVATLKMDETTNVGKVARLIVEDRLFSKPYGPSEAHTYLKKNRGYSSASPRIYEACEALLKMGFLKVVETNPLKYQEVPAMLGNIKTHKVQK